MINKLVSCTAHALNVMPTCVGMTVLGDRPVLGRLCRGAAYPSERPFPCQLRDPILIQPKYLP
jgi:hypothetical protein